MIMEVIRSSKTSVHSRAIWRYIPENANLLIHLLENHIFHNINGLFSGDVMFFLRFYVLENTILFIHRRENLISY
jgi:glycosidase